MAPKSRTAGLTRKSAGSPSLPAAEFKTRCLELMDRVRETGMEYVVTKHGRPVAKLVPYVAPQRRSLFGALKGSVLAYERPFDPIDGEYDIER
ncbi:MAG TPA: type II toxin-antitoxin system prevent-host-death family antitoxin [Vicinamibacterales bacterium]